MAANTFGTPTPFPMMPLQGIPQMAQTQNANTLYVGDLPPEVFFQNSKN